MKSSMMTANQGIKLYTTYMASKSDSELTSLHLDLCTDLAPTTEAFTGFNSLKSAH